MKKYTEAEIRAMAESCIECAKHRACGNACPYYKPGGADDCLATNFTAAYGTIGPMLLQLLEERRDRPASAPIRLFVSQPMAGRSETEIRAEREEAVRVISNMTGRGVDLLDNYRPDFAQMDMFQRLAVSLPLLAQADWAFFADHWEKDDACLVEKYCAEIRDIDHLSCDVTHLDEE